MKLCHYYYARPVYVVPIPYTLYADDGCFPKISINIATRTSYTHSLVVSFFFLLKHESNF